MTEPLQTGSRETTPDAHCEYRWAVVHTHPHKEHLALLHLERQKFICYCPRMRRRIRHARRFEDVLRPLFPGYLFVKLAPNRSQWRPILSTIGVRTLICEGEQPSVLPRGFVEGLMQREREGAVIAPQTPYQPGQAIRFAGGPFDGLIASVLSVSEKERLFVLLELLQGQVRVRVHANQVISANIET